MRIELKWKYIHYDVDQLTYRYGRTHVDEPNTRLSQTGANESDTNMVQRFAITGTARLRRLLNKFISAKVEDANDALPTDKTKWGFEFNSDVTADGHALAELMHWFVVRWCVYQWCLVFAPAQAIAEKAELKDLKRDLDKLLGGGGSSMPMKEALVTPDDEAEESVVISYAPRMDESNMPEPTQGGSIGGN